MCGIAGFIGTSKNPKVSYELITKIFDCLETRGTDAAGIWGVESKNKPKVIYHKEPIKSSEFVRTSMWSKVQPFNPNILFVHARKTSPGVGGAYNNSNNHPFVSADKRIGVIHNGKIHEFSFLKDRYETKTDCDSEIILRMYEASLKDTPLELKIPDYLNQRIGSIKNLWSVLNQGSCASAIGELHPDGSRTMLLFRNEKRPLWIADLRDLLGQIFFFSSSEIWAHALSLSKNRKLLGNQKIGEMPPHEIWSFRITNEDQIVSKENFLRIRMSVDKKTYTEWDDKCTKIAVSKEKLKLSIVSDLDANEKPPKRITVVKPKVVVYDKRPATVWNGVNTNTNSGCSYPSNGGANVHKSSHTVETNQNFNDFGSDYGFPEDSKSDRVFEQQLDIDCDDDCDDDYSKNQYEKWPLNNDDGGILSKIEKEEEQEMEDELYELYGGTQFEEENVLHGAISDFGIQCSSIIDAVNDIESNFVDLALEQRVTDEDFIQIMENLREVHDDLESILKTVKNY